MDLSRAARIAQKGIEGKRETKARFLYESTLNFTNNIDFKNYTSHIEFCQI
jgi:hypothetical protein